MSDQNYIRLTEAAAHYGVRPPTLQRWLSRAEGVLFQPGGARHTLYVDPDRLDRFMRSKPASGAGGSRTASRSSRRPTWMIQRDRKQGR